MKPPVPERIRALEEVNAQMLDKIDRMREQIRHNQRLIRRLQQRAEQQDIDALINAVQAERLRRKDQSRRDRQRSRMTKAARYREGIEQRIEDCLRMNGKIP